MCDRRGQPFARAQHLREHVRLLLRVPFARVKFTYSWPIVNARMKLKSPDENENALDRLRLSACRPRQGTNRRACLAPMRLAYGLPPGGGTSSRREPPLCRGRPPAWSRRPDPRRSRRIGDRGRRDPRLPARAPEALAPPGATFACWGIAAGSGALGDGSASSKSALVLGERIYGLPIGTRAKNGAGAAASRARTGCGSCRGVPGRTAIPVGSAVFASSPRATCVPFSAKPSAPFDSERPAALRERLDPPLEDARAAGELEEHERRRPRARPPSLPSRRACAAGRPARRGRRRAVPPRRAGAGRRRRTSPAGTARGGRPAVHRERALDEPVPAEPRRRAERGERRRVGLAQRDALDEQARREGGHGDRKRDPERHPNGA